ncbi:acyloxyacyl hydrolase [uncultured Cohaesibacter sp.]|uniref:acyloxyacyl hydrolase n=1 Tax=uncultured Cohaesibacter sp. TaxID=1002546 RepID=UPI0029C92527|nr:acyloxyacyl hydrolase [uncultured Cohaesibacter sp.]
MIRAALISALMLATSAAAATAADYGSSSSAYGNSDFLSELRMGVMSHDVTRREDGTVDLQAEVLFNAFGTLSDDASVWQRFLTPRPHIGASMNTDGKTSYGYAGFSWLFPVYGPVFIEGSFGGMIHDGKLNNVDPNREPLGTRALFRETGSIGVDLERVRVMLTVEHSSNAGLGNWNHGLTNVGARVGYKF